MVYRKSLLRIYHVSGIRALTLELVSFVITLLNLVNLEIQCRNNVSLSTKKLKFDKPKHKNTKLNLSR